jgi:RNA polymerase sigma-70 factor (ECF subfamily)
VDRLTLWLADNVNWLRNQLTRRGRAREDAEDLIQEGIVRVYEYQAKGGQVREPEAVLVRTVARLAQNEVRDAHRELYSKRVLEDLVLVDPSPCPDDRLDIQQRLDRVIGVLDSVSPRTREIFLLHRLTDAGHDEIARKFGISISAVEKHVARAVAALVTERMKE